MINTDKVQNLIYKFGVTIGMLPTSFKNSLTYEEQLFAIHDYIENTLVPALNTNVEALQELQNLFIQLQNYVNKYFDDLDVQDEINQKLDEMAQSGTLQEIIASFLKLNSLISFDNVENMKNSENLINGSFAKTLGFYSINDGGNATYKIRTITNEDIVDNATIIALENNNLVAELITTEPINILKLGAKGDNNFDNYNIFNLAISKFNSIFVPAGNYKIENSINITKFIKINGTNRKTKIYYTGTDYLFNCSTMYSNPATFENIEFVGNAMNNFIDSNANTWGACFKLFNSTITNFYTAFRFISNFNNVIKNCLVQCDGEPVIVDAYDRNASIHLTISNMLFFENTHFRMYSNRINTMFKLYNLEVAQFTSCTFEHCSLLFDYEYSKVNLDSCWIEDCLTVYRNRGNSSFHHNHTLFGKYNRIDYEEEESNFDLIRNLYQGNYDKYDINAYNGTNKENYNLFLNTLLNKNTPEKQIYRYDMQNSENWIGENLARLTTKKGRMLLPFNILEKETNSAQNLTINLSDFTEQTASFLIIAIGKSTYSDTSGIFTIKKFCYAAKNANTPVGDADVFKPGSWSIAYNDNLDITRDNTANTMTLSSQAGTTDSMTFKLLFIPFGKANWYFKGNDNNN